ncbi:uncharacterized protein LOC129906675 [Episyrphus balteatus]|uniref:uncharacterized protein LOC129906675 n=1 Tax=Episyrphus balteatus TaxID=286459 RepID=UPI002484F3B1|nr:uncharacterized protein LOC129906675 [Episyrphus balteatus]
MASKNNDLSIESIAAAQQQIGDSICTVVRNYNKDGPTRKTLDYLIKKRDQLEDLWEEFDKNDTIFRDKFSEHMDHEYFQKDYFQLVRQAADLMRSDVSRRLLAIEEIEDGARKMPDQEKYPKEKLNETQTVELNNPTGKGAIPKPSIRNSISKPNFQTNSNQEPQYTINQMNNKTRFNLILNILKRSLDKVDEQSLLNKGLQFRQIKIRSLEQNWDEITCLYRKLDQELDAEEVEDYFDIQEKLEETLLMLATSVAPSQETATDPKPSNIMMKLPKIELPKFDGEYLNWLQFHDLFKQMIHDQPIPPAQKLYFLRANVTGKAKELIRNFKPTDSNYEVAWGVLVERFNNKRLLLTAQLNKLLIQSATTATSSSLRKLHDNTKECLQVISNLNVDIESWDPIVVHCLLQKLDKESREKFEFTIKDPRNSPSIEEFLKFVEARFQTLEAINPKDGGRMKYQSLEVTSCDTGKKSTMVIAPKSDQELICHFCNSSKHGIYNCNKFLSLSGIERGKAVHKLMLCRNCLKKGHYSQSCIARRCQKCNMLHNTLLHQYKIQKSQEISKGQWGDNVSSSNTPHQVNQAVNQAVNQTGNQAVNQAGNQAVNQAVNNAAAETRVQKRHVYLATAVVNVISSYGVRIPCRALLDSGSQLNFVTTSFIQQLGTKKYRKDTAISGIGAQECRSEFVASITFESKTSDYKATIEANLMARISDYQAWQEVDVSLWKIPNHIQLSDPSFWKANQVDMLLGSELFFDLFIPGEVKISSDLPTLRNTKLGWVVAGGVSASNSNSNFNCHIVTKPSLTSMDKLVRSSWETESHDTPIDAETEEEHQCEEHFKKNTTMNSEGKFVVTLPFKQDPIISLGDSMSSARKRFFSFENKLNKDEELKTSYISFMQEYEALGHMTPLKNGIIPRGHYVIPHHCVMKPESSTTKLRVVFDASAKTTSGLSLNDILMVNSSTRSFLNCSKIQNAPICIYCGHNKDVSSGLITRGRSSFPTYLLETKNRYATAAL